MYALFMALFGQTVEGIHLGLLCVNIISIILLFLISKKTIGNYSAVAASAAFALLSFNSGVLGFAGHATNYVTVFALGGVLFLLKAYKENKLALYFWSGILLSLSGIMKQQGFLFCVFGVTVIVVNSFYSHKRDKLFKAILFYSFGVIIPLAIMFSYLMITGVFQKFWFLTIQYASDYERMISVRNILPSFKTGINEVTTGFYLVWILMILGILSVFVHPKFKANFDKTFLLLFLLFSFASVCPGFYFRQHYFITFLPAAVIFFCVFADYLFVVPDLHKKLIYFKLLSVLLIVLSLTLGLIIQKDYFFIDDTNTLSRQIYGESPFPESINIANYINANSNKEDKIAIFGSEPQIYFYANRLSATGYLYMYPLMECHKNSLFMQQEMAKEVELNNPRYIIVIKLNTSWWQTKFSNRFIIDWAFSYINNNKYQLKGIIDIYENITFYKWNQEAMNYNPKSNCFILVFENNPASIMLN